MYYHILVLDYCVSVLSIVKSVLFLDVLNVRMTQASFTREVPNAYVMYTIL